MGLKYNKNIISKNRQVLTSGPADNQRKQVIANSIGVDSTVVNELKKQISNLQGQLSSRAVPEDLFTSDQVNSEIEKAIKIETALLKAKIEVLENKNKDLILSYSKEIEYLKNEIKSKEDIIKQLIAKPNVVDCKSESNFSSSDRPQIEPIFVDPVEKNKTVEKFIDVKGVTVNNEDNMTSKVDKLRNLMNKLPKK